MKIIIKKSKFSRKKKKLLQARIKQFLKIYNIQNIAEFLTLDWSVQATVNKHGGYYGGFISLFNEDKIYVNLTVFYELDNLNDINQILWAVCHELIHCKQMYTKEIIISNENNCLEYQGQIFGKLDFRNDNFLKLYNKDPKLATEYHIKEIPWEKDCYLFSDLFINKKSFDHSKF